MNSYSCLVKNENGQKSNFRTLAQSEAMLFEQLNEKKLYLIRFRKRREMSDKLSSKDMSEFSQIMRHMISSGLSIKDALQTGRQGLKKKKLENFFDHLMQNIESGKSLFESMRCSRIGIDPLLLTLVKLGEHTGQLEIVFEQFNRQLEKKTQQKEKIVNALMYPAFVFFLAISGIAALLIFVVPGLSRNPAFADLDVDIKKMQQNLYLFCVIACLILGFIAFLVWYLKNAQQMKKIGKFQYYIDSGLLKIPVLGHLLLNYEYINLFFSLEALVSHGYSFESALHNSLFLVRNSQVRRNLEYIYNEVQKGQSLSKLFSTALFSRRISAWLTIGEETGELETVLKRLWILFDHDQNRLLNKIMIWIEPGVICLLGILILYFLFVFILPFFNIYELML